MSPRPYRLGKRQEEIDRSRRRVLEAARALLAEPAGYPSVTVDAVARRADVARATVYYQFRSKAGLLEALCDELAEAGRMGDLTPVFAEPDPHAAVRGYIAAFGRFWAADRIVMRRLRALAVLDADVHAVIAARDEGRRSGLEILVRRLTGGRPVAPRETRQAVAVLQALTSFETFDAIAGEEGDLAGAVRVVTGLAEAVLSPWWSQASASGQ